MKIAPWRFAAGLGLVALAACNSSPRERPDAAPNSGNTADSAPMAQADAAPKDLGKAELGKPAPNFTLTDLDGKTHSLADYRGKTVVLEWFSPSCPYCVYAYSEKGPLAEQPERLQKEGVVWLSVNSQNPKHPGANVKKNTDFVEKYGLEAPILMDPDGLVGRAYGAKTTPHCFVIDAKGVLVYAGALDNAPAGKTEGDAPFVNYVDAAVADLRAGKPVVTDATRAYG